MYTFLYISFYKINNIECFHYKYRFTLAYSLNSSRWHIITAGITVVYLFEKHAFNTHSLQQLHVSN